MVHWIVGSFARSFISWFLLSIPVMPFPSYSFFISFTALHVSLCIPFHCSAFNFNSFHSVYFRSISFLSIPFNCVLFHFIPLHRNFVQFFVHFIPVRSIPSRFIDSISFHCIFILYPFWSIFFKFVPFHSVSFRFIPFACVLFHFIPFCSIS